MNVSDVIAGIAAAAALWAWWRTEQTRGAILRTSWDQSRHFRKIFWRVIRGTYTPFVNGKADEWPREISTLIGSAGMPPNVPVKKGAQIKHWYDDNYNFFNADQKKLCEFVIGIYPPRTENTIEVMDASIIETTDRDEFDEARRNLATFFHRQQEQLSNRKLYDVAGHTYDDVVLLSWLELALVRGTQDERLGKEGFQGKRGLFNFGNYLSQHRTR